MSSSTTTRPLVTAPPNNARAPPAMRTGPVCEPVRRSAAVAATESTARARLRTTCRLFSGRVAEPKHRHAAGTPRRRVRTMPVANTVSSKEARSRPLIAVAVVGTTSRPHTENSMTTTAEATSAVGRRASAVIRCTDARNSPNAETPATLLIEETKKRTPIRHRIPNRKYCTAHLSSRRDAPFRIWKGALSSAVAGHLAAVVCAVAAVRVTGCVVSADTAALPALAEMHPTAPLGRCRGVYGRNKPSQQGRSHGLQLGEHSCLPSMDEAASKSARLRNAALVKTRHVSDKPLPEAAEYGLLALLRGAARRLSIASKICQGEEPGGAKWASQSRRTLFRTCSANWFADLLTGAYADTCSDTGDSVSVNSEYAAA